MKRLAILGAALVLISGQARADYISAITPAASPIATFSPITISPGLAGQTPNNNVNVPSSNTVSFGITYSAFGTAQGDVSVSRLGGPGNTTGSVEYFFSVAVTNATNHAISSFVLRILPTGGPLPLSIATFDLTGVAPFMSGTGPQFQSSLADPVTLWFGGQNGGGGEIQIGATQVFNFSLDTGNTVFPDSAFRMTFAANPEPGTMALAGLALGAGGFYVRRRRKSAVTEQNA